ncbi:MAG: hypothetical protein BGP25_05210 [Lysobacterales bacterium 63-13]|nr:MAG: hypothetical protein BGP25_05210 [Xanthomonadales bacterium 63-13]
MEFFLVAKSQANGKRLYATEYPLANDYPMSHSIRDAGKWPKELADELAVQFNTDFGAGWSIA